MTSKDADKIARVICDAKGIERDPVVMYTLSRCITGAVMAQPGDRVYWTNVLTIRDTINYHASETEVK